VSLRGNVLPRDPSAAWAETISGLAERHRDRRALYVESRWPLAHACSAPRRESALAIADVVSARHAFCCRALA
jgi:hypothetical protein